MKLQGKVALITGAGRGIAEVFAEEGADVAVNYIASADSAEEVAGFVRSKGRRATTVKADVADRAEVEAMMGGSGPNSVPSTFSSTMPASRQSFPFSISPTISGPG